MAMQSPPALDTSGPQDLADPLQQAIVLYQQGNIQESEAAFKQLIGSPQYGEDAYYWLGLIRLKQGNLDGAYVMLEHALALDPNNANVLSVLGSVTESRGALDEARSYYSRALAINPGLTSTRERLTALSKVPRGTAPRRQGRYRLGRSVNVLILVMYLGWWVYGLLLPMSFILHNVLDAVLVLFAARAVISLFPIRQQ